MWNRMSKAWVEMMCRGKMSMWVRGVMLRVRGRMRDGVPHRRGGRRRRIKNDRGRGGEEERGALATSSSGVNILLLL